MPKVKLPNSQQIYNVFMVAVVIAGWIFSGGQTKGEVKQQLQDQSKQLVNHEGRLTSLEDDRQTLKAVKAWMDKHP